MGARGALVTARGGGTGGLWGALTLVRPGAPMTGMGGQRELTPGGAPVGDAALPPPPPGPAVGKGVRGQLRDQEEGGAEGMSRQAGQGEAGWGEGPPARGSRDTTGRRRGAGGKTLVRGGRGDLGERSVTLGSKLAWGQSKEMSWASRPCTCGPCVGGCWTTGCGCWGGPPEGAICWYMGCCPER